MKQLMEAMLLGGVAACTPMGREKKALAWSIARSAWPVAESTNETERPFPPLSSSPLGPPQPMDVKSSRAQAIDFFRITPC
jgi:hypothetical protein